MKAQLIIYKLNPNVDDAPLVEKIKSFSNWAKITDNCWIVITEKQVVLLGMISKIL